MRRSVGQPPSLDTARGDSACSPLGGMLHWRCSRLDGERGRGRSQGGPGREVRSWSELARSCGQGLAGALRTLPPPQYFRRAHSSAPLSLSLPPPHLPGSRASKAALIAQGMLTPMVCWPFEMQTWRGRCTCRQARQGRGRGQGRGQGQGHEVLGRRVGAAAGQQAAQQRRGSTAQRRRQSSTRQPLSPAGSGRSRCGATPCPERWSRSRRRGGPAATARPPDGEGARRGCRLPARRARGASGARAASALL